MKNVIHISIAILTSLSCFSCREKQFDQSKFMIFETVEYIPEFPKEFILQNRKDTGIDLVGVWDFAIQDSILILSTRKKNGALSILSLPDKNHLGDFLNIGEGPLEVSSTPSISDQVIFTKHNNELQAYIYDFSYGKLFRFNVDGSIKTKETEIDIINDSIPKYLFDFLMIDSTTYFCKEIGNMETQQFRFIIQDGERKTNSIFERLNKPRVLNGLNFNILSTMARFSDKHNKIVEMHFGLNYLNIYSLDSSFKKTIILENKIDNITLIENLNIDERMFKFSDIRIYDNFFGIVYINEIEKTYKTTRKTLPQILLFDWNGKPIAKLKLENFISSFDIDFIQKEIYTFDIQSDEFFKYDISEILEELNLK